MDCCNEGLAIARAPSSGVLTVCAGSCVASKHKCVHEYMSIALQYYSACAVSSVSYLTAIFFCFQGIRAPSTAQLTAELSGALSWHELGELVSAYAESMDLIHVEYSLRKLQTFDSHPADLEGCRQLLSRLLHITVSKLDGDSSTVSRVCQGFATLRMQFSEPEFLSIQKWITARASGMEAADISYLFSSYAQLWVSHGADPEPV